MSWERSIRAEQAFLGAVLLDPAGQRQLLDLVTPGDMRRPWHLPVVGIGAASGEEPRILGALDARADDFRPGVNFRHVIHGRA